MVTNGGCARPTSQQRPSASLLVRCPRSRGDAIAWSWPTHRHQAVTAIARKAYLPHPHSSRSPSGQANGRIARAGRPHGLDPMPRRETAPRSCPGGPTPTPPGIRRSAISCPSGLSLSCRMPSARTSLGEVRTRRRSPTRRWSERVSEASRILPEHRGASVSAARHRSTLAHSGTPASVAASSNASCVATPSS